jgi:hypothetical protein
MARVPVGARGLSRATSTALHSLRLEGDIKEFAPRPLVSPASFVPHVPSKTCSTTIRAADSALDISFFTLRGSRHQANWRPVTHYTIYRVYVAIDLSAFQEVCRCIAIHDHCL